MEEEREGEKEGGEAGVCEFIRARVCFLMTYCYQ